MDSQNHIAFADLQGFIVNKQFVLKELCFSLTSSTPSSFTGEFPVYHFVFKEPFAYKFVSDACKRGIIWSTIFQHGFYWTDGNVEYKQIDHSVEPLRSPNLTIYVKGTQKVAWLRNILNSDHIDCRNIEDIGCNFRLSDQHGSCRMNCGQHKQKVKICALRNVRLLEEWYDNNIS